MPSPQSIQRSLGRCKNILSPEHDIYVSLVQKNNSPEQLLSLSTFFKPLDSTYLLYDALVLLLDELGLELGLGHACARLSLHVPKGLAHQTVERTK